MSWSRCHSVRQFWALLNIDNCDACQIDHILEPVKILVVWRQFDLLVQWSSPEHASGLTGRSSQGESRDLFHNCLSHTYERTDISAAIMKDCFRSYQNKSPCSSSEIGIYELGVDHSRPSLHSVCMFAENIPKARTSIQRGIWYDIGNLWHSNAPYLNLCFAQGLSTISILDTLTLIYEILLVFSVVANLTSKFLTLPPRQS